MPVLLKVALPKFVVAPLELKVPLFAKVVSPLKVVLPPALKVPAFAKFDRPFRFVVPLVEKTPPVRLLNVPPKLLMPPVAHVPELLTTLLEPPNVTRPVKMPALVTFATPPDVESTRSAGEFAVERTVPLLLLLMLMLPPLLVAEITGLIAAPEPMSVPVFVMVVWPFLVVVVMALPLAVTLPAVCTLTFPDPLLTAWIPVPAKILPPAV